MTAEPVCKKAIPIVEFARGRWRGAASATGLSPNQAHTEYTVKTLECTDHPTAAGVAALLDDLAFLRTVMVNLYFIGPSGAGDRGAG